MRSKFWIMSAVFLQLVVLAGTSAATTYYVKKSGNDNNAGTSWSSPWLTTAKVQASLRGGDTVYFATGIWRNVHFSLGTSFSGTRTDRTVFACSSFVQGIARWYGSDSVSGWGQYSGSVYRAYNNRSGVINTVFQGDSALVPQSSLSAVNSPGKFYQSANFDTFYVWAYGGGDPDNYDMEISDGEVFHVDDEVKNISLWGITLKYGGNHVITISQGSSGTSKCADSIYIEHCRVSHSAGQDNINQSCIYFARCESQDWHFNSIGSIVRACSLDFVWTWNGSSHNNAGMYTYGMTWCRIDSNWVGPHVRSGFYIKSQNLICITNYGNVFAYNYISPNTYYGFHMLAEAAYDTFYGNIIVRNNNGQAFYFTGTDAGCIGGGHFIANNTVVNASQFLSHDGVDAGDPINIKYNVIYRGASDGASIVSMTGSDSYFAYDSNMYYAASGSMAWDGSSWSAWHGRGFDLRSNNAVNPGFANLGGGDFSRPGAPQEMNLSYGGQTWTRYGAVQLPSGPDVTPPVISNVRTTDTTSSSVTVRWTTNENATSRVEYGTTTSYGSFTNLDGSLVTAHAQSLNGLAASTTYHYRVHSSDAAGNEAISGDFSFRTLVIDVTPPVVSGIAAQNITESTAIIYWVTDEPATSQVDYGLTAGYGSTSVLDPAHVLTHYVGLPNLQANTSYHFRVRSRDAAGNEAVSGDNTFRSDTVSTLQLLTENMPNTVSSTYAGYSNIHINDGTLDPRGGTGTTWASVSDSTVPHWVEIAFTAPKTVRRAKVLWAWNSTRASWACSQQYFIQYWNTSTNSFIDLTLVNNGSADSVTITDFAPVSTTRMRYLQPPNMGAPDYRRVAWMAELQFYGSDSAPDTIPPAPIMDLNALPDQFEGSVQLSWTAPGSMDGSPRANFYDIRYSLQPITESNWLQASSIPAPPAPLNSGAAQEFSILELPPGIIHYLAIKSFDDAGNVSQISNVTSSYSAGLRPPIAFGTFLDTTRQTAMLVGMPIESYLPVYYEFQMDTVDTFSHVRSAVSLTADSTVSCMFDSITPSGTYFWRFRAASSDQSYFSAWSNVLNFGAIGDGTDPISADMEIHAYPNPFRASEGNAGVMFVNLPNNAKMTIATISGNIVREEKIVGSDEWFWDVKNNSGGKLASGVYLYKIDSPNGGSNGKIMIIQ